MTTRFCMFFRNQVTFKRAIILIGILAALIMLSQVSCRDDNDIPQEAYDTVSPLEYFPAFPGSWWIFDNNDTMRVSPEYKKYIYNSAAYDAIPEYDTLMLPELVLNGIYNPGDSIAYVREYAISKPSGSNYRDPSFMEILSVDKGTEFSIGGSVQGHRIAGKTIVTDTSIVISGHSYDHVLITIHFDYACTSATGGSPEECAYLKEYYAKDVGLIRRERLNYNTWEFGREFDLVSYQINR